MSKGTLASVDNAVDKTASAASSFPELLYVNSKITEPSKLSPDLFTEWYNDIHIPDIFATSGIKQAYRYHTTVADPSSVERPYLALYPVKFAGYTTSKEFFSIPVTSDVLPGPSHEIFDVADFDTRYYNTISSSKPFTGRYVLTVQGEDRGKETAEAGESSAVLKCYFARQNRRAPEENEIGEPPSHLSLIWYETEQELEKAAEKAKTLGKIATFKLLKGFEADSSKL